MGLDWCLRARESDGRTPVETLGAKLLTREDPETVEVLRKEYERHQEAAREADGGIGRFWLRDFDLVLEDAVAAGMILTGTIPESVRSELPKGNAGFMGGPFDFRGGILDGNTILARAGFDPSRLYEDHTVQEMFELADEFERALAVHAAGGGQAGLAGLDDAGAAERDVDEAEHLGRAITWLRFWAGRGHPFHAWS